MQATDDVAAMRWRVRFRDVMRNLLERGYQVVGFHRGRTAPYYILDRRA